MPVMPRASKTKPTAKQLEAWRDARVANYADTRSVESLARMVVELEDAGDYTPEFEIDDEWPRGVAYMKVNT
jgi:hypothetical protein